MILIKNTVLHLPVRLMALAIFFAGTACMAQAESGPIVSLSLEEKIDEIKKAGTLSKKRGIVSYLSRLDSLRDMMQARGDLNGVLAVDAESKRMGEKESLKASDIVDSPAELKTLMTMFFHAIEKQRLAASAKLNHVVELERAHLQSEVTRLTKAGEIADAVTAQKALKQLDDRVHAHLGSKKPKAAAVAAGAVGEGRRGGRSGLAGKFSEEGAPLGGFRRDPESGTPDLLLGESFFEKVPGKRAKRDR